MARNLGLQILRGTLANIPSLAQGEMYFATDVPQLIIGTGTGLVGTPLATVSAASFVGIDSATQGGWHGIYGADGYEMPLIGTSLPAYATVTPGGGYLTFSWANPSTDVRALQLPLPATTRQAATWYNNPTFTIDVNVGAGTHRVALYMVDWDASGRAATITVNDSVTAFLLSTQNISSYQNGKWMVWNVSGHVKFTLTATAGANAVTSGIFFG